MLDIIIPGQENAPRGNSLETEKKNIPQIQAVNGKSKKPYPKAVKVDMDIHNPYH